MWLGCYGCSIIVGVNLKASAEILSQSSLFNSKLTLSA